MAESKTPSEDQEREADASIQVQSKRDERAQEKDNRQEEAPQSQRQSDSLSVKDAAKSAMAGISAGANFLNKNVFSGSDDGQGKEQKGDDKSSAEDKAMIERGQKFGAEDVKQGVGAILSISARAVNAVGNFLSGAAKLAQGQTSGIQPQPDKKDEKDTAEQDQNKKAEGPDKKGDKKQEEEGKQQQSGKQDNLVMGSIKLLTKLGKDLLTLPFNEPNNQQQKTQLQQDKPQQEGPASKNEGQLSIGKDKPGADRITAMLKGEFGQDKVSQGKDGHKIGLSNGANLNLSNDKKTIGMDKCTNESIGSSMKLASKLGATSVNVDKMPQASQGMAWAQAQMNKLEVTGNYKPDKGAEDFLGKLQKQASNPQMGAHRAKGNDEQKSPVNAGNAQTLAKAAATGGASLAADATMEVSKKAVEGIGKAAGSAMDAGKSAVEGIGKVAGPAMGAAKSAVEGIGKVAGPAMDAGKSAVEGIGKVAGPAMGAAKSAVEGIGKVAGPAMGAAKSAVEGIGKVAGPAMSAAKSAVEGIGKVAGPAMGAAKSAVEGIGKAAGPAMKAVQGAAGGAMGAAKSAVEGIGKAAGPAMKAAQGAAGGNDGPDAAQKISADPTMSQNKQTPTNDRSEGPGKEATNDNKASSSWKQATPSQLRM